MTKIQLTKTHLVNGREFAPGTVLKFKDATAQGLVSRGIATVRSSMPNVRSEPPNVRSAPPSSKSAKPATK